MIISSRSRRLLILLPMIALVLAACGTPASTSAPSNASAAASADAGESEAPADNAEIALRFGFVLPETHAWYTCGIATIQEALETNPDSNLTMQVFPGGELGSNEEMVESVSQGNLDITLPGVGSVSPFYEEFGVLEAPYAFDSWDHVLEVAAGDIGQSLIDGAREQAGLHVLGDFWYIGWRHVTANVPVESPEDLEGITMRSQDTPIGRAIIESLGGQPTPVDFGELYLALSQGVVDAQENVLPNVVSSSFQEVQDYISLTYHSPQAGVVLLSEATWERMSEAQQQLMTDAANDAAAEVRSCIETEEEEILESFRAEDSPIEVIEEPDIDAFRTRAEEVITQTFADSWGELYTEIRATSSE